MTALFPPTIEPSANQARHSECSQAIQFWRIAATDVLPNCCTGLQSRRNFLD